MSLSLAWTKDSFMLALQFNSYRDILQNKNYLAFWTGFTFSSIGDALTRVALT